MQVRTFVVAIAAVFVLVSCGLVDGGSTLTLPSDPGDGATSTEAPDMAVPESDDANETPWWLLLVVLGGFLILIIAFVSKGSKKKLVVAPAQTTWKDDAKEGYAGARWLFDAMSEDLATWRGNATHDKTPAVGATAGTALAETWAQLETRIGRTSDSLYAVEAASPDHRTANAASTVVASMRSVRRSVDDRAEARMNYRTVEASVDVGEVALQDAREREVRASRNLAEARSAYGAALTGLSTVL